MKNNDDDLANARTALEEASRYAKQAEDGEAKARGLAMVADGYRRLWETQQMWDRSGHAEVRIFSGEPDPDLELWLGDAFESWLPGTNELLVISDGVETRVRSGYRLIKLDAETVLVH